MLKIKPTHTLPILNVTHQLDFGKLIIRGAKVMLYFKQLRLNPNVDWGVLLTL